MKIIRKNLTNVLWFIGVYVCFGIDKIFLAYINIAFNNDFRKMNEIKENGLNGYLNENFGGILLFIFICILFVIGFLDDAKKDYNKKEVDEAIENWDKNIALYVKHPISLWNSEKLVISKENGWSFQDNKFTKDNLFYDLDYVVKYLINKKESY